LSEFHGCVPAATATAAGRSAGVAAPSEVGYAPVGKAEK
jgi:hypothetical protein